VLAALDVAVVVQDQALRIVYANPKATSLLGLTAHEMTSRTTVDERWDVVGPDGERIFGDAHPGPQVLRTGEPVHGVLLGVKRSDQDERVWILVSAVPEHAPDGSVTRVIISFTDVSVAQRTMRAHEATYLTVFQSMVEGLVVHNLDGSIREANTAAERVLGLTFAQMKGRSPLDPAWRLILPDGQPATAEHIPSEITTRTGAASTAILGVHRPNGERAWLDVHATPMHELGDDKMTGVLATFVDVTAERDALAALESQRAQTQRVLDAVPGVVYQFLYTPGRGGHFTFAAGRISEMSGMDPAFVSENPQALARLLDARYADEVWREVAASAAVMSPFEKVLPFRTVHGEARWVRIHGVPQATADGVLYTGVMLDATREQLLAEGLRLRQRREAMGDMAGGIAHNFNNMLAVILPNVQLARETVPSAAQQPLADAERAAASAADLVKRMLALGRAESRDDAVVNLVPIVYEAVHLCRQMFDRSIVIAETITVPEATVHGSASSMQQVVLNLLLNARDAMAQSVAPRLTVQLERSGATSVLLTVRDTGAGMSKETLRRVGEPFFTTKAPGQGTGLGLASVFHSIAEARGSWRVESVEGEGTTFFVELPLADAVPSRASAPLPAADVGLHGAVLIIDDEPMVRTVLMRQMQRAGMETFAAEGAEAALALLRGGTLPPLAVILMDLSMPGMGGEQALPLLREAAPGVPVIALSGHVPDTLQLAGAAAVLQKPMGQRELVEAIRRAMVLPR
jgi:PAS domain S-box-containing protein